MNHDLTTIAIAAVVGCILGAAIGPLIRQGIALLEQANRQPFRISTENIIHTRADITLFERPVAHRMNARELLEIRGKRIEVESVTGRPLIATIHRGRIPDRGGTILICSATTNEAMN